MPTQTTPPLNCQLLCACGCAYLIDNGTQQNSYTYTPDTIFAPVCGWTNGITPASNPAVIVGAGSENDNAALVGIITTAAGTTAIVVAFQGTLPPALKKTSIKDWISDLMATPEQETALPSGAQIPGMIHYGIFDSVNYIFNDIITVIQSLQKTYGADTPLYITGHSKGGGMSSLFAAMLYFGKAITLPATTAVCTFASPMIGNQDFVNEFPSSIPVSRFENYLDIVPFLAPSASFYSLLEKAPVNALPNTTLEGALLCEGLVAALILAGDQDGAWGYVPLGTLNFIEQDGTITSGPNNTDKQIALDFASGLWSEVLASHSHLCGKGYMNGTCGSNVNCNGTN
jgi:Lipase (class 3)